MIFFFFNKLWSKCLSWNCPWPQIYFSNNKKMKWFLFIFNVKLSLFLKVLSLFGCFVFSDSELSTEFGNWTSNFAVRLRKRENVLIFLDVFFDFNFSFTQTIFLYIIGTAVNNLDLLFRHSSLLVGFNFRNLPNDVLHKWTETRETKITHCRC